MPLVSYYTFAVFCKRLFHAGLQDRAEIRLFSVNPHELGISSGGICQSEQKCESIGLIVSIICDEG